MFTHFIIPISDQYFDDSDIYNSVEIPVLFAKRLTTSNKTYLLMKMDQPISCENLIQNLQTIIDFSDIPISTFIAFKPNLKIQEHSSVIYFYDLPEELQIFSVFKTFIKCISFYQTITSYFGNNAYKISFETKKLQLVAEFVSYVPFSSSKGETEYLQMVFDEHDFPLVQITNIQKNATINDINNIINNYCKIKPKYIDLFVNPKSSVGDQVCQIIAKNKNDAEQIVKSTNQGKLGACVMTSAIFANIDEIIYEDRNYQIQQQQNKSKDEKNSQINENSERKTASKKSFQINFKQQTRNQSTTPHNNIPTTKTQPSTLVYGLERIFELHTLKHAKSYCVVTVTKDTFNKCIQFYDQSIRRNSQDTGLKNVCMVNFTNGIDPKRPMKSTSLEGQLFRQSNISLSLTEDLEIYQYNRSHPSNASSDFCAYSKNVSLLKDDQENPLKKSVLFDVISIPPVYYIESEMTREECKEIMRKRITRIFHVAIEHRKQYLILGAFGCGSSNNNPYDVASIFLDLIKEFHDYFKYIIFPIPSSDNHQIFSEVLHEVTQKPLPHEQKTQQSDYPAFRSVKGFGSNNYRISNKTLSQILSSDIKSFGFNKIEMIDARSPEAFYRMNIKGSVNMPLKIANPHKTKLHTQHFTSIQEIYEKFYDKDTMMIILTKYCDIDSEIIVNQIKEIHKNSSQRELPLHIFILIGGVNKVYFQRKDLCNFNSQYIVPSNQLVESRLDFTGLFRRVSPTKFSKIYLNYATLGFSCLYVVDCRSPREFIAGHIKGAINCHPYTMNISELYEKIYKKNGIYFFHCEFSHQRGPTGCLEFIEAHELHGRSQNEPLNAFVIHDGYGNFYNKFPDFCDGKYESEFM